MYFLGKLKYDEQVIFEFWVVGLAMPHEQFLALTLKKLL